MNRIEWTVDMEEQLSFLWDRDTPTADIAKEMRIPKNSVIGKAHRMKLKRRKKPAAKKKKKNRIIKPTKQFMSRKVSKVKISKNLPESEIGKTAYGTVKPLMDVGINECHWPIGDPRNDDFGFCCGIKKQGSNYCENHASIAMVKGKGNMHGN